MYGGGGSTGSNSSCSDASGRTGSFPLESRPATTEMRKIISTIPAIMPDMIKICLLGSVIGEVSTADGSSFTGGSGRSDV